MGVNGLALRPFDSFARLARVGHRPAADDTRLSRTPHSRHKVNLAKGFDNGAAPTSIEIFFQPPAAQYLKHAYHGCGTSFTQLLRCRFHDITNETVNSSNKSVLTGQPADEGRIKYPVKFIPNRGIRAR